MANRLKRWQLQQVALAANAPVGARLRHLGVLKLLGLMLALGFGIGLLSVHLIPLAVRAGMSPPVADKLPYVGLACGLLIGLAAAASRAVMTTLQVGISVPLGVGAMFVGGAAYLVSFLWLVALLDVFLIAAAVLLVFLFVLGLLGVANDRFAGRGGPGK
jgi:hypothetical protein